MTLDQLNARLASYLAAETAILAKQEYTLKFGDGAERRVRRADLDVVRSEIENLRLLIARETGATTNTRRVFYVS